MPEDSATKVKYLLVGRPGVGKTTLLRKIAAGLSGYSIGGFFTQEIRERGRRVGFSVETFDGRKGIMAHGAFNTGPRVGKYRVDVKTFEQLGVRELERALRESDIILIDEIGKMEMFSSRFRKAVLSALDSDLPLVATVMASPLPFADALKAHPDITLLEVNLHNRDRLAGEIVRAIQQSQTL